MAQEKTEIGPNASNRILVLDANILLRAVLGKRVRVLIERYCHEVPLFIPSACVAEVHEYLPSLCARRGWDVARALDLLESLLRVIKVVESGFYADCEEHAKRRIAARDLDDWPPCSFGAGAWSECLDGRYRFLRVWPSNMDHGDSGNIL
jgi:predicted nucleic acid-binding protein